MSEAAPFAYDTVLYPSYAFAQTHPDRLATIATLFGMKPRPASRCRVLELGCGVGGNLIPMAYQYPDSEFIGIDLAASAIEKGKADVAALGLDNLDLRACDIMQVDAHFGEFDYIIVHGVYSWVPSFVRAKILSIFRERLAPNGVAYVSFNAYPGSHLRDLGRRMMLYHVRSISDPEERVRQGRALLDFVADASDHGTLYGKIVRDMAERAQKRPDSGIYHDDLDAGAQAFLFHQVAAAAEVEGLQYLCEGNFSQSAFGQIADHVQGLIGRLPEEEVVLREQYLDLIVGRWFRETLWCHADVKLERRLDPQHVRRFLISVDARTAMTDPDPRGGDALEFKGKRDHVILAKQPLTKAAFIHLGRIWPAATDFPTLLERATSLLAERGDEGRDMTGAAETLADTLYRCFCAELIDLHLEAPHLVTTLSARPQASAVARHQAEIGAQVTNLRHAGVPQDDFMRSLLPLVDGTRTIADLAAEVGGLSPAREGETGWSDRGLRPQAVVTDALRQLARNALLVA